MKANFIPNSGKYRKIDIYARPINGNSLVYLHSTTAYDTLHHAIIGTLIFSNIEFDEKSGYRRKRYIVYSGQYRKKIVIDPYSITAEFAKK